MKLHLHKAPKLRGTRSDSNYQYDSLDDSDDSEYSNYDSRESPIELIDDIIDEQSENHLHGLAIRADWNAIDQYLIDSTISCVTLAPIVKSMHSSSLLD